MVRISKESTVKKQDEVKQINATLTQILSYKEFKNSGKSVNENQFVLALINFINQPTSRRHIQELSGLPINHLTRVFYDLENEGLIYVAKIDKCRYTGRKVNHYSPTKIE